MEKKPHTTTQSQSQVAESIRAAYYDNEADIDENEDVLPIPGIFPGLKLADYKRKRWFEATDEPSQQESSLSSATVLLHTSPSNHIKNSDPKYTPDLPSVQTTTTTTAQSRIHNSEQSKPKKVKKSRFDVPPSLSSNPLPPSLAEHFVEANCTSDSAPCDLDDPKPHPTKRNDDDKELIGPLTIMRTISTFEPSKVVLRRFETKSHVNDLRETLLQYHQARITRRAMQDQALSATESGQPARSASSPHSVPRQVTLGPSKSRLKSTDGNANRNEMMMDSDVVEINVESRHRRPPTKECINLVEDNDSNPPAFSNSSDRKNLSILSSREAEIRKKLNQIRSSKSAHTNPSEGWNQQSSSNKDAIDLT